jgi:hypothetical protein
MELIALLNEGRVTELDGEIELHRHLTDIGVIPSVEELRRVWETGEALERPGLRAQALYDMSFRCVSVETLDGIEASVYFEDTREPEHRDGRWHSDDGRYYAIIIDAPRKSLPAQQKLHEWLTSFSDSSPDIGRATVTVPGNTPRQMNMAELVSETSLSLNTALQQPTPAADRPSSFSR